MAESIKEAEAEVKGHKNKDLTAQIAQLESESNSKSMKMEDTPLKDRKKIDNMTQDLIDGALSTKSVITYDGKNMDVDNIDPNKGAKQIVAEEKMAIKEALKDRDNELGIKGKDSSKAQTEKKETKKEDKKEEKKDVSKPSEKKVKKKHHKKKHHKKDGQKSAHSLDKHEEKHEEKKDFKKADEFIKEFSVKTPQELSEIKIKKDDKEKESQQMHEQDIFNEASEEDKEIMKSIEYAEKKLGSKMGTPKPVSGRPN